MKTLICILYIIVFPPISFSQQERFRATAETMINTFNIQGDKLTGTCFTVSEDGKQYFLTAAHLFKESHRSGDVIPLLMFIQNQWQSFDAKVYFHADRNVDIALHN